MFEVGEGGGLRACQPSVVRTETLSFWRLTSLSFESHLEKKWSICLVIKCKQRFFGSISTICFFALSLAHNDVRLARTGNLHPRFTRAHSPPRWSMLYYSFNGDANGNFLQRRFRFRKKSHRYLTLFRRLVTDWSSKIRA